MLDRFWPSNLFLGGIPGAWYDPTDLSTMFQDSAGTTPVTAVEQPVGLILDKSGNGNHASQSTAASRPTYRARYNLLTFSEQFENAYWSKFQSSVTQDATTAPDGATTADKLVENAVNNAHAVDSSSVTVVGTTFTFSVYLKAAERSFVRAECIQLAPSVVSRSAVVNLSNGALTSVDPAITATATSVGNGWYRCVFTTTYASATSVRLTLAMGTSASTFSYLGDGTSGLFLWGAQLLTAADVTATGNAYQRIAAATVYDTAPIFRPYLAFDGVDDSLSTAAINFTATDKMSVFSGVTKNTDGSAGCVAELSATAITNNGSFALFSSAGGAVWYVAGRGTALGSFACATFTAPITNTISSMIDIAQPALASELIPRINTTVNQTGASGTDIGTGNFGNWPLYIGRRGGTTLPFNGRLYSLIVRGAASSVTEIADTELWVNARTGAF